MWKAREFHNILLWHCDTGYNQNTIDKWTKGCILLFRKMGDLGLAKNYWGITLTSIAAKIYNDLPRKRIEPKIENVLWKNQHGFQRKFGALKTCQEQWTIETGCRRGSGKSVLAERHDNDDDIYFYIYIYIYTARQRKGKWCLTIVLLPETWVTLKRL